MRLVRATRGRVLRAARGPPGPAASGIGRLLLDVAEERAWQMGASQVALDTSEQATDLIAWYGRRGYRHVQEVDWKVTNYRSVVLSKSLELPHVILGTAGDGDGGILAAMLVDCVNWDPARPRLSDAQIRSRPELWRYVAGWGRPGDQGDIAEDQGGAFLAAAWFRHYPADEPGFGFLAGDVPEVSIAVRRPWRAHGLGGRMLAQLEAVAGQAGITALSLSVETTNPAARLYRRRDYEETARADGASTQAGRANPSGHSLMTMSPLRQRRTPLMSIEPHAAGPRLRPKPVPG